MAVATFSVNTSTTSPIQSNDQRYAYFDGTLQSSAFGDTYPAGGIPIDSVLQAAGGPGSKPAWMQVWSESGSGYIYQYIRSTGKIMVLQVPPNGSLTTAAPLQQLSSGANSLSGVFQDVIRFRAAYIRNT